jgi:hypothetical protein
MRLDGRHLVHVHPMRHCGPAAASGFRIQLQNEMPLALGGPHWPEQHAESGPAVTQGYPMSSQHFPP